MSPIIRCTRITTRSGSIYEVSENANGEFFFAPLTVSQERFLSMVGVTYAIRRPYAWPLAPGCRLAVWAKEPILPTSDKMTLVTSSIETIEEVACSTS